MIRVVVGGDICPMGRVQKVFAAGDAEQLFRGLLPVIRNADIAIANLECPLIEQASPTTKAGPVLGADADCARGLAAAGWKAVNLANNHSYDHGRRGLSSTIDALKRAGLGHFGAGMNVDEAKAPYRVTVRGQEVVFYSMAEQEFSVARTDAAGSNPLDIIGFVEAVMKHKQGGLFIVLVHGGVEYNPLPTPEMQRRCRFMVDMGADAVLCCHAHCSQPWEVYRSRPIVYGLGNLIFEADRTELRLWHEGYLAELTMSDGAVEFRPVPYVQSLGGCGVRTMNPSETGAFLAEVGARASRLGDPAFLRDEMAKFSRQKEAQYLSALLGYNRVLTKVATLVLPALHSTDRLLRSLLMVRCESHREVLDAILEDKLNDSESAKRGRYSNEG